MTGALITSVLGFPGLGGGVWGWSHDGFGGFVWTVFWVGGAIYLIYYLTQRNKARNGAPPCTPAPGRPGASARGAPAAGQHRRGHRHLSACRGRTPAPPGRPPARAPRGRARRLAPASPRATPTAAAAPAMERGPTAAGLRLGTRPRHGARTRSPATPGPGAPAVAITAGLALLVGGGIKALDAANVIDLGTAGNAVVWASGAAVLGLGILVAGLRGRTRGHPRLLRRRRPGHRRDLQRGAATRTGSGSRTSTGRPRASNRPADGFDDHRRAAAPLTSPS